MVERHTHDGRYFTKTDLSYSRVDVVVGAVRMTFGQQRTWTIRSGYAVVTPETEIGPGATLNIEDGGQLVLVG